MTNGSETPPLVEVRGVTLQYKTRGHLVTATYRVDFAVRKSDRFVLLGPSGCGKSTLLKAVGGYLRPTEGEIRLKGHEVIQPGPDRMMVFQEFDQLLPWKTVVQNVMFPLIVSGKHSARSARGKALDLIAKVNLSKFGDSYPHVLSGGMKQRVAIARGMAMEPDVLLMDEPFAALDALTRVRMQDELLALWDETKFTVIFVTHSIPEAIKIGNRILLLTPHLGQVKAEINSAPRGLGFRLAHADCGGAGIWHDVRPGRPRLVHLRAKNQLDIPEVFAGLLSIILIGLFIENVVFRLIEMKTVRRWGMQS